MKERENQGRLESYLERAMAIKAALTLFEWDNETLAPQKAGAYTARIQGALSAAYQELMTDSELVDLLKERESQELSEEESAIVREAWEERRELSCIPPKEYRAYQELVSESARTWADAKKKQDFDAFAPVLEKIISYQKKFAGYQARKGQRLYDVMLDHYEKGFSMERLDEFFGILKRELVPFLQKVIQSGVDIPDDFLTGNYFEV